MHSRRYEKRLLVDGFDALGNDLQAQCAAYAHDRMDDRRVERRVDIRYKTAIDLDLIERKSA